MINNTEYSSVKDEELIKVAQNNDKTSLSILITRYSSTVRKIASSFNYDSFEFDDRAQEGMLGLLNAILTYNLSFPTANFKTYASVCISNRIKSAWKCHNSIKNKTLNQSVPLDEVQISVYDTPELRLIEKEQYNDLLSSVYSVLSANEKTVLRMYLSGNSYSEIATILGKPEKSVDNALQRIKRKLSSAQ